MVSKEREGTLGFKLKKAREEKGYSLEDIQKITKLRSKYIEAIEKNDFSVFSGDVYAKGSIRNYADIVGLDYKNLWEEYDIYYKIDKDDANEQKLDDQVGQDKESGEVSSSLPVKPLERDSLFTPRVKRLVTVIAIVLVVVAGLWGGYSYIMSIDLEAEPENNNGIVNNKEDRDKEDKEDKEVELDNDLVKDEEKEFEKEDDIEIEFYEIVESESWDRYDYVVSGADHLEIEGDIFEDRCWLERFSVDGEVKHDLTGEYQQGEDFSLTVQEEFEVLIGRPVNLEIKVNDKEVEFVNKIEDYDRSVYSPIVLRLTLIEEG